MGGESVDVGGRKEFNEIWYLSFESLNDFGGGLATYIRHVAAAAKTEGRRVRIFQISRGTQTVTRNSEGPVTIVYVPDAPSSRMEPLGYWMNLSWQFADAVCKEIAIGGKPRAIEAPDGFALGYFLFQRKLVGDPALQGVPLILVAHTPIRIIEEWIGNNVHALPNWWTFRAEKWCFKAADAVVTLSHMLERELVEKGYLEEEVRLWRSVNPYDRPQPRAGTPITVNRGGAAIVGMASRMINWKGLRETLLVAKAAKAADLPMKFELCGGMHDDFHRARSEFAALFDDNVVSYLGVLDSASLDARREHWTCQLHPSPKDNFPYAVIEAMGQGLPCFIGSGNGVAEALSGELGDMLVVDFSDPVSVLSSIARADRARELLAGYDFESFGAKAYFANRDLLIADLAKNNSARKIFPFVDGAQARVGLCPTTPVAPSATGARLTVVVPYYNMAVYIEACVKSVLQSSIAADIVIVNDGSNDPASIAALDAYRVSPRITVLDIPNGGVARARNFGLERAATEFVALLDADDTVESSYYAKALWVLDKYENVAFVGCWANDFRDQTGETIRYWPTYNAEPLPNIIMNNTNCQALVYRTDLCRSSGRHDPALKMYLDDWDAMLGMLEDGLFGVMLPEPLFNYRQRPGSIFSSGRSTWDVNYSYIIRKRAALLRRNAVEALLFANANGPNRDFHLLGEATPVNNHHLPHASRTGGRLKTPHRFARSLAKRLIRFSEKGYR